MARYNRINIDGKSLYKTETRKVAGTPGTDSILPGTFAVITNDSFAEAAALSTGRLYVIDVAYHSGLTIDDAIPAGQSTVGNYVEEGRELVVRAAAGEYIKDAPIAIGADGLAVLSADGVNVIGFSQDEVTLSSTDLLRVRFRAQANATDTEAE